MSGPLEVDAADLSRERSRDELARRLIRQGLLDDEIAEMILMRDEPTANRRFWLIRLEALRQAEAAPEPWWMNVDGWTRREFMRHVEQDRRDGRTGSKKSIAQRVHMSPTALWRRWEKVRQDGESWPSGKKGPPAR